jgi:Tol biopolymer transport system component
MRQLTHNEYPIESAFTWRPDGRAIACVAGGRVCQLDAATGSTAPLTEESNPADNPRSEAVVYSPDGSAIAFVRPVKSGDETFNQIFVVDAAQRRK